MPSKIQQIPLQKIDGGDTSLSDYQGDVLLVVNVASKCGLTPQYEALEAVHERFRDRLRGFGMTPTEDPEILWNFEKFLVSRDGAVVARFAPDVTPDDERVTSAIERELRG